MICSVCRHCGLCEGDGTFASERIQNIAVSRDEAVQGDVSASPGSIGIAVDIGTTTVCSAAFLLSSGMRLAQCAGMNPQASFGRDVVSRISHDSFSSGHDELVCAVRREVSSQIRRLFASAQATLLSRRAGRGLVSSVCVAGNTAMLSLFAGYSVQPLASYPFSVPSEFGFELPLVDVLGKIEFCDPSCKIYFPPVLSPFVGADTVCAMASLSFFDDASSSGRFAFLADLGTNCEMAVKDYDSGRILCTSSSAGPAFEAQGISCGMSASPGAIASVEVHPGEDKKNVLVSRVIGGGEAKGICGTGLVGACYALRECGFVDSQGTFVSGDHLENGFPLAPSVRLLQSDVRAFQLAKGAVKTGLAVLSNRAGARNEDSCPLYLCGSFGTLIDVRAALGVSMIPFPCASVKSVGNAALDGAVRLLFSKELRSKVKSESTKVECINLAELNGFQSLFMESLAF